MSADVSNSSKMIEGYGMTFVVLREKVRAVRRVRDIDGMLCWTGYRYTNFQTMLYSAQSTDWRELYK
jgi:hypothetical protein